MASGCAFPATGSHLSSTAKTNTSSVPLTYGAVLARMPVIAVKAPSSFRCAPPSVTIAAHSPTPVPTNNTRISDDAASSAVWPNRSKMTYLLARR